MSGNDNLSIEMKYLRQEMRRSTRASEESINRLHGLLAEHDTQITNLRISYSQLQAVVDSNKARIDSYASHDDGGILSDPQTRRGIVYAVIIFLLILLIVVGGRDIINDVPQEILQ